MSAFAEAPKSFRARIEGWLRVEGRTKPLVYAQVFEAADVASLGYWLELVFAAGIATFGLVLNSPAVIIGAMLISPLMGPILATGLALAAGDLYLGVKAVLNLAASLAMAVGLSAALVWALPFHSATSEILARTHPNLLDLGVALLSGLAGSVVMCRGGGGGGVTALPGVAIAVALMPPALHGRLRGGQRTRVARRNGGRAAVHHQPGGHRSQCVRGFLPGPDGCTRRAQRNRPLYPDARLGRPMV